MIFHVKNKSELRFMFTGKKIPGPVYLKKKMLYYLQLQIIEQTSLQPYTLKQTN